MVKWVVYVQSRPLNGGFARSYNAAILQARDAVRSALWEVAALPEDFIEVEIDGDIHFSGTAEGFMGKAALRKMNLGV